MGGASLSSLVNHLLSTHRTQLHQMCEMEHTTHNTHTQHAHTKSLTFKWSAEVLTSNSLNPELTHTATNVVGRTSYIHAVTIIVEGKV